jgi:hypothetical protein
MSGWIDPIDMKVRRILADAFAKAHRPHLTIDPPECERCHGNGEIGIAGMSINPSSGVLARDPQNDDYAICPDCLGSGIDE